MDLTNPIFHNADKAREHLERLRWRDGPVCPHCGEVGNAGTLKGKTTRPGLHKCYGCRKPFTVTVGTVFERSKIPLNKWVLAAHLMASSKKGISAHQVHRTIGVSYKTAWFMMHRLREAMKEAPAGMLGGSGNAVEADETFWGNTRTKTRKKPKGARGYEHKEKVLALVERNGKVRSFHVPTVSARVLNPIITAQIARDSRFMTDDANYYKAIGKHFDHHGIVNHTAGEYVRGDDYTQTVESFFSLVKRGLHGAFHHVSPAHLPRYLNEFDFRWNYRQKLGYDDTSRADILLRNIEGKRLTFN